MDIRPETMGRKLTSNAVCARYGITRRTLGRWLVDAKMHFVQPTEINGRLYFEEAEIIDFDRRTLLATLAKREAA